MPRRNSVSASRQGNSSGQHSFAQVPSVQIQRSVFQRNCGYKTTFDEGFLIPVFVDEALPGDTFNMQPTLFGRMATPLHPLMDNLHLDVFWFGVPYRLIWDNWQKLCGEQVDPGDSTDYLVPIMTAPAVTGYGEHSLQDYLGLPTKVPLLAHTALATRAYNLIYNEWFRDQNLQDSVVVDRDDGPDAPGDYVLLRRGKRHDYFTSCLPFPQKGPAVTLPLGTTAPVTSSGDGIPLFNIPGSSLTNQALEGNFGGAGANYLTRWTSQATSASDPKARWDEPKLQADLSLATAATINELRESFQVQRMFEKDARGGSRYTEILRSHFGVVSPDQRLQRPEFLGGGTMAININPVAATAITLGATVGTLGAFSTFAGYGNGFVKSFTEHTLVLGMICVRADLNYQQGLERMFSRRTRFDHYWPSLAHIGEQAVLSKELFADAGVDDDDVFGYQERFAEYRYKPSKVTGQMRSNAVTPLDTWHLSQEFATRPLLNEEFIVEDAPVERVIAVVSEPHFLLDCAFNYRCARAMPTFGVPGFIDHF